MPLVLSLPGSFEVVSMYTEASNTCVEIRVSNTAVAGHLHTRSETLTGIN
jgi:hypothetical protein